MGEPPLEYPRLWSVSGTLGYTSLCNTAYFAGPLFLTLGFTYETDEEEFGSADNKEVFDCLKLLK